jgi:hypothetical protein
MFLGAATLPQIRLINLKGKEFVFGGSENSNRTDRTPIERSFREKLISFFLHT